MWLTTPFSSTTIATHKSPYNVTRVKSDEEQPFFRTASDTPINRKNVRSNRKGMPRNRVACQRFTQYLSRREKISIGSGHKPLQAIFKKSVLAAPCRLQRMLLGLQQFNLDVRYKPGSQMYRADHLSRTRPFTLEVDTLNPFDSLTVSSERPAQLQKATAQDAQLQSLRKTVLVGWPEQKSEVPIHFREYWN